ncbi:RNA polymerase-associated protein RapA [Nymphon striatum]|nr:RNA polymerase-associated protein RapA [Nymphon striatum]
MPLTTHHLIVLSTLLVKQLIPKAEASKVRITGHSEHNHCIVYKGIDETDTEQQSDSYGLAGPRIQPLSHQLYIAHQVARRHAPRVLLADEVGLGKTIEAGLILHQQILTERVNRALIVVPETLTHQWLVEMLRRFNLHFTVLDEERCFAIEDEGDEETHINPFESAQTTLADPDRFYDLHKYVEEEKNYKPVNDLVQWLQDESSEPNDEKMLAELEKYLGKEAVTNYQKDYETDHIIQDLLDRHGTGRVLYRNTRDSVGGFPQRELHSYELEAPELYAADSDDLQQQLHPESGHDVDNWLAEDPRVEWLEDWLIENPKDKVLLICAQAETALALEEHLRLRTSINATAFHEGLNIIERDRAAAYFAAQAKDGEIGAQILLCSEIGSEGRNFHALVRLDRIGQTSTIQIHAPYFKDTAQEKLLNWYHEGLNAFQHVCPVGHSIFEVFENELRRELISSESDNFDDLIKRSKALADETLEQMQQGRDRLLELNSCNKDHAEEVIDELITTMNTAELSGYMDAVFDEYGVDQQGHGIDSFILETYRSYAQFKLSQGLSDEGLTATLST